MSLIEQFEVTAPASYPGTAQVEIDFVPNRIILILDDSGAGKSADISFDGSSDHAHLHVDHSILRHDLDVNFQKIWVKGANSCAIRIMAYRS